MCGISGYINTNYKSIRNSSCIFDMLHAQQHRGPDDTGIRAFSLKTGLSLEIGTKEPLNLNGDFEGVLGFNRLSILDLSSNGHQPMASPDSNVFLTLNSISLISPLNILDPLNPLPIKILLIKK